MRRITIGFIPLADTPLIAAHERGFAEAEGLAFDLVREVSWANIRDKLSSACSTPPPTCSPRWRWPALASVTSRCR